MTLNINGYDDVFDMHRQSICIRMLILIHMLYLETEIQGLNDTEVAGGRSDTISVHVKSYSLTEIVPCTP